ncbi:MAG TPA: tol-pal system protein YbgF [Xanthobacteraceae bacterium]
MARFALRVTTAFALGLMMMAAARPGLSTAWAQETERPFGLLDRIFSGSERFSGGGERGAAGTDQTAQMSAPDLVVRLERLESQIRQLTGAIEQLQFRNQQLEAQVRRMQEDNEYRLQELGSKGAAHSTTHPRPQGLPPPGPAAATGRRGDAFDPTQNPNAPGAPHTLGSINAPGGQPSEGGEPAVAASGGRVAHAPLDLATQGPPAGAMPGQPPRGPAAGGALATLPPSQTPRDEYDLAYGYVLRKDYALAADGFRSFLSKYPDDRLVGDATFWLGESLFQRQQYRDAAEAFLNVSTKYESIAKAPDALLRLGQSLAALGEKEAACASLGEVLRKFPRASASVRQGVEREQKRARC